MDFSPTQLSEIDAVEVVNLKDVDTDRVNESAQQTANLWLHLPPGAFGRCHIPPFGLRFYRNGEPSTLGFDLLAV